MFIFSDYTYHKLENDALLYHTKYIFINTKKVQIEKKVCLYIYIYISMTIVEKKKGENKRSQLIDAITLSWKG